MVREIVTWPDPRLRAKNEEVERFDDALHALIEDLFATMYATETGVGLAAPQIGVNLRLAVIDTSRGEEPGSALVLANPAITRTEGKVLQDEGCLSIPGESEEVERAERVWMRAQDRNGKPYEIAGADELLAIAIQHEIDHLDGVLYVDHLSALKRELIKRRAKQRKAAPASARRHAED